MSIYKPYTYLIGWTSHNLYYYGVRYKAGCSPDDFWVKYFTSSKRVHSLRKELGEPDVIQIRKVFESADNAISWELKVLRRMKVLLKEEWINANVAGAYKLTQDIIDRRTAKAKATKAKNKQVPWNKGKTGFDWGTKGRAKSEAAKLAMRKPKGDSSRMGRYHRSENNRTKLSEIVKGTHWWNNGAIQTQSRESPGDNWVRGRLR